jgi:hypothetical protein
MNGGYFVIKTDTERLAAHRLRGLKSNLLTEDLC